MSAGLAASTVTPGRTPPDASRTTPLIVPVETACAMTTSGNASTNADSTSRRSLFTIPVPFRWGPPTSETRCGPRFSKRVVDDRDEGVRLNEPLTPGRVEFRRRFGGDRFLFRTPFRLQLLHAIAHGDEHVSIARQGSTVAKGPVARHDAGRRVAHLEPLLGGGNHAVDLSAGTRVDEGVLAIEERVAQVQHITDRKVHVDVRVGMSRLDVTEVDVLLGARQLEGDMFALREGLRRHRGGRHGSEMHSEQIVRLRKPPPGVLMRDDLRASLAEAFVVIRVIEVPVRVDGGDDRRVAGHRI